MVELFLVERDARGWYTEFWGRLRHDWSHDLVRVVAGIPVASEAALASYRAAHDRLRMGAEPAGVRSSAR